MGMRMSDRGGNEKPGRKRQALATSFPCAAGTG